MLIKKRQVVIVLLVMAFMGMLLSACANNTGAGKSELEMKYDEGYKNGYSAGKEDMLNDELGSGDLITAEEARALIEYAFKHGYGYGYQQGENHTKIDWEAVDLGREDAMIFDVADEMFLELADEMLTYK